jgi:hypothetical protein
MNPLHTEFLTHDRIANLRREASVRPHLVADRAAQASRRTRLVAISSRTVGRVRTALRLATAWAAGEPSR